MKPLTTTLNKIYAQSPRSDMWTKLLRHLNKVRADDDPLPFSVILESNGLDDVLWCCRSASEHDKEWRLFIVWCARQIQCLTTDARSVDTLDAVLSVVERFANGNATQAELAIARNDMWTIARDTTRDVRSGVWVVVWNVVWAAATPGIAGAVVGIAARDVRDAGCARDVQAEQFKKIVTGQSLLAVGLGYAQHLEINKPYSETFQNNCAVIECTGDGIPVGTCTHYLKNGTTCPRHGVVKVPNEPRPPIAEGNPSGARG